MKHVIRAAFIAAMLAACSGKGGSTTPASEPIGDDPVAEMTKARDAMCACESTKCADQVGERMNAIDAKFAGQKLSDEQADQVAALADAIEVCVGEITGGPEDERQSPPQ